MSRFFLLIPAALLLIAASLSGCEAIAQRRLNVEEKETVRRTWAFSPAGGTKALEVDNVNGRIRVSGYDGPTVEMTAYKTIRARSQDALQRAKDEVKLDITDKADTINIYVDQPGHERSTLSSSRSRWEDRGYEVSFDFELRVPRASQVHLWTV